MSDPLRILIIDDNEDDRLAYRRALTKNGDAAYTITEAEDGDKGLKALEAEEADCVLLDYSLPGRNGIEVLKRLRASHPFVPVIMMTGQGNEDVAVAAMREDAQNYIVKSSINSETLKHTIGMAIEHCLMQERLENQRNSLEVFTRALAHDLKEPIRTIRSFTELIQQYETNLSEKSQNYFDHVQKAAERMNMLIDTVFLYTRLDAPEAMAHENVDLGVALKEAQANAELLIKERRAVVHSGELPVVSANPAQMTQLFQNLVCNAINHSDKPVRIEVGAQQTPAEFIICVKDNGPGIPEAYINKIFEPFRRMSRSVSQGAGLGLAICKKIADSHEGRIWCESAPGEGASFFFAFPVKLVAGSKQTKPAAIAGKGLAPIPDAKLANVLLVDDSRADVEITRFRLFERSRLECNLTVARDAEEALMILKDKKGKDSIDLVLLDINMPEVDGFDMLERMRGQGMLSHMAVIMCTGSIYDKDMQRAEALGAAGYITKPIDFATLKTVIESTPRVRLCPTDGGYALLSAA